MRWSGCFIACCVCGWLLSDAFHPSALHPAAAVVVFFQPADDDSPAGTGVYEPSVFQVDAHMSGFPFLASVVEEHQIAFLEVAFGYFPAVFGALFFGAAFQFVAIHFLVDGRGET